MDVKLFCDYLDTYGGRDKVLRTLSYAAKLATLAATDKKTEAKFKTFSSQMSGCRVVLRLLDDLPTLYDTATYGLGRKEPDGIIRWLELLQNTVNVIFNPVEHICWAGEHQMININVGKWEIVTTWFWIISLDLALLKSLWKLKKLGNQKYHARKTDQRNAVETCSMIHKERWTETLVCTRLLLDISYAVSYLPPGVLWGGKFKTWQVGALGTASSLIGLYQALHRKVEQKKNN